MADGCWLLLAGGWCDMERELRKGARKGARKERSRELARKFELEE